MRKTIAALAAGLALVATSAMASGTATARFGDRVGATSDDSSEFSGVPLPVLLIVSAVLVAVVAVASDDASESD